MGAITAPAPPPVTIAWVVSPGAPAPSAAAERSLVAWAEARGVKLALPHEAPLPPLVPNPALAEAVEAELGRAKDALTSQDGALAEAALHRAEELLTHHPELPQAAWLLAEVWRTRASRYRLLAPRDAKLAATAWARAAALDGGRAPGVGEASPEVSPDAAGHVEATLLIDGLPSHDAGRVALTLDGVPSSTRLSATAGEHQVRVVYDGALVWAGWVALGQGSVARVSLPRTTPCSRADLGRSRFQGELAIASGVTCGDWVLAREDTTLRDELALAVCSGDACGPVLRWHVGPQSPIVPDWRERGKPWPAWATWALVGASVVVVTGATLAATGVFRPTHDEPSFTTGGVHVASGLHPITFPAFP